MNGASVEFWSNSSPCLNSIFPPRWGVLQGNLNLYFILPIFGTPFKFVLSATLHGHQHQLRQSHRNHCIIIINMRYITLEHWKWLHIEARAAHWQNPIKKSGPIHECPKYVFILSKSLVLNFPYKNGNYKEIELIKIRYNFQNTRQEFFVLALIEALI